MNVGINREHKSRLFSFFFGREDHKDWTLSLYNAVNHTDYTDEEELYITTIEDVLYMGRKNDLSFLVRYDINLYEHQSSINPNMPVRDLIYAGLLYDSYISENELNIYGPKVITLPIPKLVVFYNGLEEQDDEIILELKDAFPPETNPDDADISVRVHMLNINYGKNKELLDNCQPLREYAILIDNFRKNCEIMPEKLAADKAIDDLPEESVIKPLLLQHKSEVNNMILTEYDEEKVMGMIRRDAIDEGIDMGINMGIDRGIDIGSTRIIDELLADGTISEDRARELRERAMAGD